ncbi:heavy-metal-associated domain-containing protein [Maribacter sp. 2308TA10-17]|uniref:heavy-metal-associated domain-containing protein n=1 Tax=Maribacter sp. 2308TA10-17 TaxID=3386276 RepID=UPI0039BD932D
MKAKTSWLFFFLTFSSAFIYAQGSNESMMLSDEKITAVITIDGMACQEGCANTISKNLLETDGVHMAEVSYETGKAIVQFDNSLLTINSLQKIITDTKVKDYIYVVKELVIKNETLE